MAAFAPRSVACHSAATARRSAWGLVVEPAPAAVVLWWLPAAAAAAAVLVLPAFGAHCRGRRVLSSDS